MAKTRTEETPLDKLLAELGKVSGKIRKASDRITDLDVDRDAMVRAVREAGGSWQQIADVLGISKQAAWERYHDEVSQ